MRKIDITKFLWIIVIVIVIGIGAVVFFSKGISGKNAGSVGVPKGDDIVVVAQADGTSVLSNRTSGYSITVPRAWYVEKDAGAGVTLYPDYDPAGNIQPSCKIEVSVLSNPDRTDLESWLVDYFRKDPTVEVEQQSVTGVEVSGEPAVVWIGTEDGIATTLSYVARGDVVYEIAPSVIQSVNSSSGSGSAPDENEVDCAHDAQLLLETFKFLSQ